MKVTVNKSVQVDSILISYKFLNACDISVIKPNIEIR